MNVKYFKYFDTTQNLPHKSSYCHGTVRERTQMQNERKVIFIDKTRKVRYEQSKQWGKVHNRSTGSSGMRKLQKPIGNNGDKAETQGVSDQVAWSGESVTSEDTGSRAGTNQHKTLHKHTTRLKTIGETTSRHKQVMAHARKKTNQQRGKGAQYKGRRAHEDRVNTIRPMRIRQGLHPKT